MKPGSIVEFIGNRDKIISLIPILILQGIYLTNIPENNVPYTVKLIINCPVGGEEIVFLEELSVGRNYNGKEVAFDIIEYREIQFPPDLESSIEEALKAPVPTTSPGELVSTFKVEFKQEWFNDPYFIDS